MQKETPTKRMISTNTALTSIESKRCYSIETKQKTKKSHSMDFYRWDDDIDLWLVTYKS